MYHGLRETEDGLQTLYHPVDKKSESTPLLRDHRQSEGDLTSRPACFDLTVRPASEGDTQPEDQRERETYASGLPWWKRPSVSMHAPCHLRFRELAFPF